MKLCEELLRLVPLWQIIGIHISTCKCHHTIWGCTDNTNKHPEQLNNGHNYNGISLLPTSYNILSNILLSERRKKERGKKTHKT
jgi:hypothetical protein